MVFCSVEIILHKWLHRSEYLFWLSFYMHLDINVATKLHQMDSLKEHSKHNKLHFIDLLSITSDVHNILNKYKHVESHFVCIAGGGGGGGLLGQNLG